MSQTLVHFTFIIRKYLFQHWGFTSQFYGNNKSDLVLFFISAMMVNSTGPWTIMLPKHIVTNLTCCPQNKTLQLIYSLFITRFCITIYCLLITVLIIEQISFFFKIVCFLGCMVTSQLSFSDVNKVYRFRQMNHMLPV